MYGLPDSLVHVMLDAILKNGPTRHLLLSSTQPILTPTGFTNVTEPAGYSRVSVAPGTWPSATGRASQAHVVLPDVTADLGVFPYWALADSGVEGADDVRIAGEFDEALTLMDGTTNVTADPRVDSRLPL